MATTVAPRGAQAALRAMRLLKLFTPERPNMALAEVSRLAGLNKTTTHRLLAALHSEGFIDKNPATGSYRLGPGLMALGVQALSNSDLRLRVRPMLKQLARETGETATLEVPIDDSMLILDEVAGSHFVGAGGNVGTRWPMHATSTGKALIAFDEQALEKLGPDLQPVTANTIVDHNALLRELSHIRRQGFAESVDELEEGFSGVGTVLRGSLGEVLGI
ncbi:MAG: IclR family transcriptional regulator, partial [Gammaproteobacteria bacterium]|nr:IclR family transcriptional regulator [Gammaproteobacteria bacterium]